MLNKISFDKEKSEILEFFLKNSLRKNNLFNTTEIEKGFINEVNSYGIEKMKILKEDI